ncbi:MAG: Bax inhibitor-1/YccA family protein [Flavobacteriaceae bacterium]|jgi:uncharacterized YccA/Bax inhibitor family protein|nr:Bax inhibitor-1/YccA family protein [Flavobacteriaceae bacterium]
MKHLNYRSGNPALNSNAFANETNKRRGAELVDVMTIKGTVDKTAIGLFLLIFSAYYTFSAEMSYMIPVGIFGGLIIAIITIFKKEWSPITVPIYAILEGLALGSISFYFDEKYNGIVIQAIGLTLCILASLLIAYRSGIIKATENFKLGIFAATGGIFLIYLVSFIMSFFGTSFSVLSPNNSSLMSIGISLFIVVIASLNLVIDFDFIEEGAEKGAPKYMEWYGAFGLLVTLIWLYLEILKLLAKTRNR